MATAPLPLPVARAEGVYLYTPDGRRILDGISSWWVNVHGHCHPRLGRALAEQAGRLEHVIFAGFAHEPAARLAGELVARTPAPLTRVFYSDDGSTAVEVGLKMAYQHWRNLGDEKRRLFLALDHAYHGDTFGAMAVGGVRAFHDAFSDLFFEVHHVQTPYSRERGSTSPRLDEVLEAQGEQVAAVLIEPMIQGAGGMIVHPPELLREVRRLTARHGIPLIADEVFTGFGRTGRMFACEHGPIAPDVLCLSKAITGGYLPFGATLTTEEIYGSFLSDDRSRTFFHGHSYTGNPLACALALESLALFDDEARLARVRQLEALFRRYADDLRRLPVVREARVLGGMAALELEPANAGGYLDDLGPRLLTEFLRRGLLLRPLGNVLYFLPPYVITDEEVGWVFEQIQRVLGRLPEL